MSVLSSKCIQITATVKNRLLKEVVKTKKIITTAIFIII